MNEESKLQGRRLFSLTNNCMFYCCLLQNSTNSLKLLKKKKTQAKQTTKQKNNKQTNEKLFSTGVNTNLFCVPSYKLFAKARRAGIAFALLFVCFFLEDVLGDWGEEVEASVTAAKAEKSFLLKCKFIISTNFCIWVNLERGKIRVIIQLPSFM